VEAWNVAGDGGPEVEDEQGLVSFLGRTAGMCMFHFQWPTNEACSQPIKKTDENPSFPVSFSFRRSREQRSRTRLERLDEWATGRAAAAPARVGSKASNPTADGATETEAPGSRRAEAAGSSGRARAAAPAQPRIAGSQVTAASRSAQSPGGAASFWFVSG